MKTSDTELASNNVASNNVASNNVASDHPISTKADDVAHLATFEKGRKYTKRTLIGIDIIYLLLLPISLVIISITFSALLTTLAVPVASVGNPAFGGALINDMSSASIGANIAIIGLLTWPFVLLFSIIVPWVFYYFKMFRASLIVLSLPVINFIFILFYVM